MLLEGRGTSLFLIYAVKVYVKQEIRVKNRCFVRGSLNLIFSIISLWEKQIYHD